MNIFYLSKDPSRAARYHCDKHVVKMILESAQLLSTAHHILNKKNITVERFKGSQYYINKRYRIYGLSHKNHPCAKWVRKSQANYEWLWDLAYNLCWEYRYRYGKIHKTEHILLRGLRHAPIQGGSFTSPPQCMDDKYKAKSTVKAYRNYYRLGKKHLLDYRKRKKPTWLKKKRKVG